MLSASPIATTEFAPDAVAVADVMAVAPDEVIAAVVVVELSVADTVREVKAAVVVPPMAPTVRVEALPVELSDRAARLVAVIIVPIVEAAPAADVIVKFCSEAALVTLPITIPALSSALITTVCVSSSSNPSATRLFCMSLESEFLELIVIVAAPVRSVTLANVVSACVTASWSA
jgi:hypothetical protein